MPTRRRLAILFLTLAVGAYTLYYYSAYMYQERMKVWDRIQVEFTDVGGLEVNDDVMVDGARVGRVGGIQFSEDGQLVTLELEPGLPLYQEDVQVEVVPTSSLGFVAVDLNPGDPKSPPLPRDLRLKGSVRSSLGGKGPPGPERARAFQEVLGEFARSTTEMRQPGSGPIGAMFYDPERAEALRVGLRNLEAQSAEVDQALAALEDSESSQALLSDESLLTLVETVQAIRSVLDGLRDGTRAATRGEGASGQFFMDHGFANDLRQAVHDAATGWDDAAQGRGTFGRLVTNDSGALEATRVVERVERTTDAALEGEGLLGVLSSPAAGETARETITGLEATLRRLRYSQVLRDPGMRATIADGLGNFDDALNGLRRGLRGIHDALPDKTFQGAVFAVF